MRDGGCWSGGRRGVGWWRVHRQCNLHSRCRPSRRTCTVLPPSPPHSSLHSHPHTSTSNSPPPPLPGTVESAPGGLDLHINKYLLPGLLSCTLYSSNIFTLCSCLFCFCLSLYSHKIGCFLALNQCGLTVSCCVNSLVQSEYSLVSPECRGD